MTDCDSNGQEWTIALVLIITGMFLESIAQIILLTPLMLPIAVGLGVDPIVFGIIYGYFMRGGFPDAPGWCQSVCCGTNNKPWYRQDFRRGYPVRLHLLGRIGHYCHIFGYCYDSPELVLREIRMKLDTFPGV